MKSLGWLILLLLGCVAEPEAQRGNARQGQPGRQTETPQTIVRLPDQGVLVGREVTLTRTQRVIQFLGIPYAQPPINKLRFAAPVTSPLPTWTGQRNASNFGPSCPQINTRKKLHERLFRRLLQQDLPDPGLSEDCLFLNIYKPDSPRPAEGWPVFVWFHGGDFNSGTPAIWDASVFVTKMKQQVIVVTVAYRLNILGFFTSGDPEAPGNYGMLDQIAALDWVNSHIEHFGGTPNNVIIWGHSAGAISVGLHMMSPLSRGKFAKAIAMSGDPINSVRTPQDEAPIIEQVRSKFGCYRSSSDLMKCLRNVELKTLIQESAFIETWGPIVDAETSNSTDGTFLPRHPRDATDEDLYAVPLIAGFTNNEQALAYIESIGSENVDGRLPLDQFEGMVREESGALVTAPDENSTCELRPELVTEAVLFYYSPRPPTRDQRTIRDRYLAMQTEKNYAAGLTQLAARVSAHPSRTPAFVYRFDYRSRTQAVTRDVPEWAGVPHMFEQPFMWGLPFAANAPVQWNMADKKMSELMMTMLVTFGKVGNPSVNTIKWEPYEEAAPGILLIERNIDMSDVGAVDYRALAFWNEYYPMVLDAAVNSCCNVTSAATQYRGSRAIGMLAGVLAMRLAWSPADYGFV